MKENRHDKDASAATPIDITQKLDKLQLVDSFEVGIASSSARSRDVELFMLATELESSGNISQAIKFYEQAFRMNPDVDRVVINEHIQSNIERPKTPIRAKFKVTVSGLLEELRANCEDYEPLEISNEILVRILGWVGIIHAVSLEECARTCKKMFFASRATSIWRRLYQRTRATRTINKPSLNIESPTFRHLYFNTPRLRTDGLYICKLSYFRPGLTDGAFYQPLHMVTYYRYLRFFGAEQGYAVMVLVTTEEPKKAIELLKSPPGGELDRFVPFGTPAAMLLSKNRKAPIVKTNAFKKTNLFVGKYYRERPQDAQFKLTLFDPQSSHTALFEIDVDVTPRRLNNVVQCGRYVSLSPPSEDGNSPRVFVFDTSDWGRFVFSRVRSYIT